MTRKYHRKDWAMYYVLLSGGSGKRLWPLSNDARPKQYLKLVNREINSMDRCSMLQRVWEQMEYAGIQDNTIITTEKEQIELIKSQVKNASIAVEPMRRDTFGAVLLSCSYLHSYMGAALDDYAVIMPVDPYTEANYFETAKKMEHMMRQSGAEIGLMGAVPSFPSTKYGYIIPGQKQSGYYDVQSFEEKPDEKRAGELFQQGALWNCGVFCVKIGNILNYAEKYGVPRDYDGMYEAYHKLPKISFDYEVLEKTENLVMVEFCGFWKDLGTWDAMAEQMSTDCIGNVLMEESCRNTQAVNELGIPMVVMGTKDLVVVAAQDGILVTDKAYACKVKDVTKELVSRPMFEERRWGTLETLDDTQTNGVSTLTRKIKIYDGMTSSYHYHKERDEIWTVLNGSGELILEGNKISLMPGKAICIRKNQRHAVKAFRDFEYIEIHVGTSVGNEDIHRITFQWDEIELSHIL